ncbi:MAG: Maf family protein [Planctomycetes bacterium]|nr:Maf family protein [Planctomycetota bacterium]
MMPIVLASRSPRRIEILKREGVDFTAIEAPLDDAAEAPPGDVAENAMRIARLKAESVRRANPGRCGGKWILAADTICEMGGRAVGKPRSRNEALSMLELAFGAPHRVVTGVCLLHDPGEKTFFDEASVTIGRAPENEVRKYVESDAWQGRAGGYDFAERRAAGWRMHCEGDPDTVAGLPWRRVKEFLDALEREWP